MLFLPNHPSSSSLFLLKKTWHLDLPSKSSTLPPAPPCQPWTSYSPFIEGIHWRLRATTCCSLSFPKSGHRSEWSVSRGLSDSLSFKHFKISSSDHKPLIASLPPSWVLWCLWASLCYPYLPSPTNSPSLISCSSNHPVQPGWPFSCWYLKSLLGHCTFWISPTLCFLAPALRPPSQLGEIMPPHELMPL